MQDQKGVRGRGGWGVGAERRNAKWQTPREIRSTRSTDILRHRAVAHVADVHSQANLPYGRAGYSLVFGLESYLLQRDDLPRHAILGLVNHSVGTLAYLFHLLISLHDLERGVLGGLGCYSAIQSDAICLFCAQRRSTRIVDVLFSLDCMDYVPRIDISSS